MERFNVNLTSIIVKICNFARQMRMSAENDGGLINWNQVSPDLQNTPAL